MTPPAPKPSWLRKPLVHGDSAVRRTVAATRLHTVCEEARCPNRHECWGREGTATFLILGDLCTRGCTFCGIRRGRPAAPDPAEPRRVAEAAAAMGLRFVVVTMVTRDDLADGGASQMARTVQTIRAIVPGCGVEVLPSDFGGSESALETLAAVAPEVFGHNIETVRRLTPAVRRGADYDRSLAVLRAYRRLEPRAVIKSAMMVGLGETAEEVARTMDDLLAAGVEVLMIGQYLQPTRQRAPVERYWTPEEFVGLRSDALRRGFRHCEAGPWVRSSYRAESVYRRVLAARAGGAEPVGAAGP